MKKNQRGFADIIFILVIVSLIGVVGVFAYRKGQLRREVDRKQPVQKESMTSVDEMGEDVDQIANWETYSNQDFGVRFQYPKTLEGYNLTASESTSGNSEIILRGRRDDYGDTLMRIGVIEDKTPSKLTLEEFVEKNTEGGESISEINIAGRRGVKLLFIKGPYTIFSEEILAGAQELIITEHSNGYLYIKTSLIKEVRPEYPKYFDQILSTFEFTE